jgi:hypothetical protein
MNKLYITRTLTLSNHFYNSIVELIGWIGLAHALPGF